MKSKIILFVSVFALGFFSGALAYQPQADPSWCFTAPTGDKVRAIETHGVILLTDSASGQFITVLPESAKTNLLVMFPPEKCSK